MKMYVYVMHNAGNYFGVSELEVMNRPTTFKVLSVKPIVGEFGLYGTVYKKNTIGKLIPANTSEHHMFVLEDDKESRINFLKECIALREKRLAEAQKNLELRKESLSDVVDMVHEMEVTK